MLKPIQHTASIWIALSLLFSLMIYGFSVDAIEVEAVRAPGGVVTDVESFSEALGGHVLIAEKNEITLTRDAILSAPLIIRGGEYVLNGAGCQLIRGFAEGDMIVIEEEAKVELGRARKESSDVALQINGGVTGQVAQDGSISLSLTNPDAGFDPTQVNGALIRVKSQAEVTMYYGTELIGGHSISAGGGIICEGGTFTIADGKIADCSSAVGGGVIYVGQSGTFAMATGEITKGYTAGTGGIMMIDEGGEAYIVAGTMSDGRAEEGGGIWAKGALTIQNGTVSGCVARLGGGIYIAGNNRITGVSLSENQADLGGGLYNAAQKLEIEAIGLESNSAVQGAGLYNAATMIFHDGVITSNTATDGGGIFNAGQATLTLKRGTVGSNQATYGGGLFNAGIVIGEGISIATNRADLGQGILNIGTIEAYQSFYCSAGNPMCLVPDENGKGTLTLKEAVLESQPPLIVPASPVDDGYVSDYSIAYPLLTGDPAILAASSAVIQIQRDGMTSYMLDEAGVLQVQLTWLLPVVLGIIAVAGMIVAVVILVRRRKAK